MYKKTANLLIKNDATNPIKVIIIVKTIAVLKEINPDGKGLFGALTLSTSISKKSFKIIADPDRKNPHIKPINNSDKEGKLPSVMISPMITHIPAANGNSGRNNSISPFIFL
ncbi:hypothetical protein JCM16358_00260 [Halanaerocella petrolearia]